MNRTSTPVLRVAVLAAVLVAGSAVIQAQSTGASGFIFLPFENRSEFKGKWDLGMDVPRYLAAYTKARYGIATVSPSLVVNRLLEENLGEASLGDVRFWRALRDQFGIRFLLKGAVVEFDVSRFTTGTDEIGGYEAYKGEVMIEFTVYDLELQTRSAAASERLNGRAKGEFADRSLALTLFGKPTQRTMEFRDLSQIRFGSEDFNATVIGQACRQMADRFAGELEANLAFLRSRDLLLLDSLGAQLETIDTTDIAFRGRIVRGTVVFVEGEDAFVNIGQEDGLQKGQIVSIYADAPKDSALALPRRVGTVELTEIRGPHLSLGKIRTGKGEVKGRQAVRVRVLD